MTLTEYAEQWGRDPQDNYAVVCYERYSVRELETILLRVRMPNARDREDMRFWSLAVEEWHTAVEAAWLAKRSA